jgi:hypothetical protein
MKAKLIKVDRGYYNLEDEKGNVIGTSYEFRTSVGDFTYKLSTKKCDEIFGIIDVEKLAEESWGDKISSPYHAYIEGFNKAKELNKDKVFTIDDVKKSIEMAREENGLSDNTMSYDYSEDEIIQSLQQPTEIEVEIEQVNKLNIDKGIFEWMPKLDSEGCLILKRVV